MTRIDDLPVRAELLGASPYGAPHAQAAVRLDVNENPYPLPDALVEAITERVRAAARTLNRYPDRSATALRTALAGYLTRTTGHAVGPESVWAANGSNEAIQQMMQAFGGPGRTALGFTPSYPVHPLIARSTGTRWITAERDGAFAIDPGAGCAAVARHRPDLVVVTSPNNPTGSAADPGTVAALYEAAQRSRPAMVLVDEAYAEFSRRPSLLPLVAGRPGLVVCRTMSKAFGAAGLRIGYLVGDPAVVAALRLVRLPYHLSSLTQAAAVAALEHADALLDHVETVKRERDRVVGELRAAGYDVTDSDANFVQFGCFPDTHRAWQMLLDHGVLIRDSGVPGRLRASIGTPADNDAFLAAARAIRIHALTGTGTGRGAPDGPSRRGGMAAAGDAGAGHG